MYAGRHAVALAEAGATIEAPNQVPGMGVHQGIPADNEVVVATQNRNFKGENGKPHGQRSTCQPSPAARGVRGLNHRSGREVM